MTNTRDTLDEQTRDAIEASVFRRLLKHLDDNKSVQNIELMIVADFCRNCLSKWYRQAAADRGVSIDDAQARERIYGLPYPEWKSRYQTEATEEQLAAYEKRRSG